MSDSIINYHLNIWDNKSEQEKREILLSLLMRNSFDEEKAHELLNAYYYGTYRTRESFIAEYVVDKLNICDEVLRYINLEKMAFDYFINDFFALHDNYLEHIFARI